MIDINIIRETPDLVKATLDARGYPQNWVDEILEHDTQWRKYRHEENILREKRNEISKLIPTLSASEKAEKIAEMKEIGPKLEQTQAKRRESQENRQYILDRIPNLLHESVPHGVDESTNIEQHRWGEIPHLSFPPKDHVELMTNLDLLDLERASKDRRLARLVYPLRGGRSVEAPGSRGGADVARRDMLDSPLF